jgi:tetratricopeptide (TPR) repeat protein
MLSIGQRVRVLPAEADDVSSTGIISYLHGDAQAQTVDIVLDNSAQEETEVPAARILPLFSFEDLQRTDLLLLDGNNLKDYGNDLFKVKDFAKAMEFYQLALQQFTSQKYSILEIGTQILIFNEMLGEFFIGMISSNDDAEQKKEYEVLLNDDEEIVALERDLIEVPKDYDQQVLQRSLYSNLAKCALKRGLKGWAVRYASLALALGKAMIAIARDTGMYEEDQTKRAKMNQFLADSLYFRCKAFLAASRPARARADCDELASLDAKKAKQLNGEIQSFRVKRQKDNRRLAKEIAKWVDSSLSQSGVSLGGDLPIAGEEDGEEIASKHQARSTVTTAHSPHSTQLTSPSSRPLAPPRPVDEQRPHQVEPGGLTRLADPSPPRASSLSSSPAVIKENSVSWSLLFCLSVLSVVLALAFYTRPVSDPSL